MDQEVDFDSLRSVEELDLWAAQQNLNHDPAVCLRRLELMCNNLEGPEQEVDLDSLHTIEELNHWADQHNMSTDPAVSLKRLELMCKALVQTENGDSEVCLSLLQLI